MVLIDRRTLKYPRNCTWREFRRRHNEGLMELNAWAEDQIRPGRMVKIVTDNITVSSDVISVRVALYDRAGR